MEQVFITVILIGFCGAIDVNEDNARYFASPRSPEYEQPRTMLDRPNEQYWPFKGEGFPTSTQVNTLPPEYFPGLQDPIRIHTARRPYNNAGTVNYPIVIERQSYHDTSELQYTYRPTQLEYKLPVPEGNVITAVPPSRRPLITIGPQLPYGNPYIQIPYEQRKQKIRRPRPPPPEFGPFGNSGPLANYPNFSGNRIPLIIDNIEYPPYAPKFTNYIPSLKFQHTMKSGTGEYDVEYNTANGIYRKESGFTKRIGVYNPITRRYEDTAANVKTGTVSWTSPEGIPFSYSYIADENGYRPTPLVQSLSPGS